jgi:hypothetical protein
MGAFQAGLVLLRMEEYSKAPELSGSDVLVLATLLSFASDDDQPMAFVSAPRIAARSRLSRRTVQRCLDHLEMVGTITGDHRHRRPTRWSFDPHFAKNGGVRMALPSSATVTPTSAKVTPAKRQDDAQLASQRRSASAKMRFS